MIDQVGEVKTMIGNSMGQLDEGCQFKIGLGVGSVCMTGLVNVLAIFQETRRSLKRWQMHEFLMSLNFAGMLTLI